MLHNGLTTASIVVSRAGMSSNHTGKGTAASEKASCKDKLLQLTSYFHQRLAGFSEQINGAIIEQNTSDD